MIRCIVIDDEPMALGLITDYIKKIPFLQLEGSFHEPLQALHYLQDNTIDLVFLDIKMPDLNGIDLIQSLSHRPEFIFITAYEGYALKGFELKAVDYLVKPVSFTRFVAAVHHGRELIEAKKGKGSSDKDHFFINASHKMFKIVYDDLLYLESYKDYTKLFLASQAAPLLVLHNLKYFEDLLEPKGFMRIHRSYIVPLRKIHTISRRTVSILHHTLPVSENYKQRLFEMLQ